MLVMQLFQSSSALNKLFSSSSSSSSSSSTLEICAYLTQAYSGGVVAPRLPVPNIENTTAKKIAEKEKATSGPTCAQSMVYCEHVVVYVGTF